MNKCHMCQQINSLTIISNNKIKSLAQNILKLKGFKDFDINKTFEICENCKQGIENVSKFWENIPETKSEGIENAPEDHKGECLLPKPPADLVECVYGESSTKRKAPQVRIRLPLKRKRKDNPTSSTPITSEPLKQRVRRCPKRFLEFDIPTHTNKTPNKNSKPEANKSDEDYLNKPEVAVLRLSDGQEIAKLVEVDNNESARKLRIICLVCRKIFDFEKVFQKHIEEHDYHNAEEEGGDKNYLYYCKLCNKAFTHHYAVRRHSKSAHSEERPLKCQYCEAHFKYKFNLDYHMAKHVPAKQFECIYCKKMFLKSYELKIHLRTHTKEKPYKCEFCSFAFAHSSNLKAHKKSKHSNNSTIEEKLMPKERFMPPKKLLEEAKEIQLDLDPLDLTRSKTEIKHEEDNIENSRENKTPSVCELISNKDTNGLELAEVSEFQKANTNAVHKIGTFKLDTSILQMLPSSATLLDLKKWPKSYQRLQQTDEKCNILKTNVEKDYKARELLPQTSAPEKDKCIIKYKPLQKSFKRNCTKTSTEIDNYKINCNKSNTTAQIVADFSWTISSTNPTSFEVSYGNNVTKPGRELIDISKPALIKRDEEQNETKNIKSYSVKPLENVSNEINHMQSCKVTEVSARPLKINNITNLKASLTNKESPSTNNKINQNLIEVVTDKSLTVLAKFSQTTKSTPKSKQESLLKPGLKSQQITHLSFTNPLEKQSLLTAKPLITKVEILPPLNTLEMLQNDSLTTPPSTLIRPPTLYKHQCTYCHKYFKQKSALTKHLRTHTGEKPYKCNLCAKSYADASNYKKHKMLHKNAAEALNIAGRATYVVQSSPAYSSISDPDPDGIEIMQSLKKFQYSSTVEDDNDDDDDDEGDDVSDTSAAESNIWENALEQALNDEEVIENIRRNLAGFHNNAILPKSVQKAVADRDLNSSFSTEDPD